MAESMPDSRSGDPGSKASIGRRVPAGAPEQTLPMIIIVTGTPGVGKTVLAKLLAKKIGFTFSSLGDLVRKERLHKGFDRRARSYIFDERSVRRRLQGYFEDHQKKGIVFETHAVNSILPKTHGMVAIVLRLDPVVLAKRLHRSEEHTSELQSPDHLVCRLLLETTGDPRDLHSFPTRRSSDLARSYIFDERSVRRRLQGYFEDHQKKGIVFETHAVNSILPKTHGMVAIVLRLDPVVLAKRLH